MRSWLALSGRTAEAKISAFRETLAGPSDADTQRTLPHFPSAVWQASSSARKTSADSLTVGKHTLGTLLSLKKRMDNCANFDL